MRWLILHDDPKKSPRIFYRLEDAPTLAEAIEQSKIPPELIWCASLDREPDALRYMGAFWAMSENLQARRASEDKKAMEEIPE